MKRHTKSKRGGSKYIYGSFIFLLSMIISGVLVKLTKTSNKPEEVSKESPSSAPFRGTELTGSLSEAEAIRELGEIDISTDDDDPESKIGEAIVNSAFSDEGEVDMTSSETVSERKAKIEGGPTQAPVKSGIDTGAQNTVSQRAALFGKGGRRRKRGGHCGHRRKDPYRS